MKTRLLVYVPATFFIAIFSFAQAEITDTTVLHQFRKEAFEHSQVMATAHYLTDASGSRLTNSPGYIKASQWAAKQMQSWGLQNVHPEAWGNFGPGWSVQKNYVAVTEPYYRNITAYPFAWTKGTNGLIKAEVIQIPAPDPDIIKSLGSKVKGKIILPVQTDTALRSDFSADATRYGDDELNQLTDKSVIHADEITGMVAYLSQIKQAVRLLQEQGALAVLTMNNGDRDGTINASLWFSGKEGVTPDLTTLNIGPEDYLTIQRSLETGIKVGMEMDIQTEFNNDDQAAYNVIGEIPGSDPVLKNEIVMIGAHLDSWHSSTGATDNAAGCSVMMEVMRMFKALNIQPKRTLRIALWSGEEQGLLGSHAYVQKHFADINTMQTKEEYSNISAYFNLDNGTGKIRGLYLEGNELIKPVFEQWIQPLSSDAVTRLSPGHEGATDHVSFDAVGIPAFEFIQDPIDYETRTHHTNMDNYDHLLPADLKQASMVVACLFIMQLCVQIDFRVNPNLNQSHGCLIHLNHDDIVIASPRLETSSVVFMTIHSFMDEAPQLALP
jgi:hypothetical protein